MHFRQKKFRDTKLGGMVQLKGINQQKAHLIRLESGTLPTPHLKANENMLQGPSPETLLPTLLPGRLSKETVSACLYLPGTPLWFIPVANQRPGC